MRKRFFILYTLFFILYYSNLDGQKIGTWVFGYNYPRLDSTQIDTGLFTFSGTNLVSFNPFNFNRKFKTLTLHWNVTNMWDRNGNLQFYTNGSKIFNYEHRLMDGGDSLKFSSSWNDSYDQGYYADHNRFLWVHPNSVVCPHPINENQYYLLYTKDDYDSSKLLNTRLMFKRVSYSLIDMSLNNGRGKVIEKERELLYGDFAPVVSATKHANGKDWWIVARGYQDTNCYYFFILDGLGVRFSKKQCIGVTSNPNIMDYTHGLNFSPDGKKMGRYSKKSLEVFDFNRCTGELSNPKKAEYPLANEPYDDFERIETFQISFSPSSQYIYALSAGFKNGVSSKRVYQIDARFSDFAASAVKVAEYDGFRDTFGSDPNQAGWETSFYSIQQAPDGKMYLGTIDATRHLHVIEEPDKKGLACNFKQHAIKLQAVKSAIPMYPNYALGADSSSCTSGIDDEVKMDIRVYPNPASDFVDISPSTVIPNLIRNLSITLTNLLGQSLSPPVIPANAGISIDIRSLPEGIYLLQIRDKNDILIKTERIVIQRDQ